MRRLLKSEDKPKYQRQIDEWRCEVGKIGHRLDNALWEDEMLFVSTWVKDLKVRVRRTCDQLGISTTNADPLDKLVSKVMKVVE